MARVPEATASRSDNGSANADRCKVLMLVQNSFVSDSRVFRIANSIGSRGVPVKLLALAGPGLAAHERVASFTVERLQLESRSFSGKLSIPLKISEYLIKTFTACLRSGAKVYHVHDPLPLAPAIAASWFTRAKVLYDVHELHFAMAHVGKLHNFLTRVFESVMLRGVDRVIMSDGASRTALFRKAHRYDKPIDFVYNCPVPVDVVVERKDLREVLGIPASALVVVFSGHVGRYRALDRIVAGMSEWPASAHFVMLGQPAEGAMKWLQSLAREGIEQRIHFYGPVPPEDVVSWLASADVASTLIENAGASFFNSAPTKMFEAIMARLPQVASDFPEIRRVVRDNTVGPVGELVDPADGQAITRAIVRLLRDPALRSQYRDNADQLARSQYNWRIEEEKLFNVYSTTAPGVLPAQRR